MAIVQKTRFKTWISWYLSSDKPYIHITIVSFDKLMPETAWLSLTNITAHRRYYFIKSPSTNHFLYFNFFFYNKKLTFNTVFWV